MREERENTVSKSVGLLGGNAAQWELTLRAGEEKPFQGQHGNITFSRYKTAMSCGAAVPEQDGSQRTVGGQEQDEGQ